MTNGISDHQSSAELTTAERAAYIIAGLGLAAAGVKPRPNPLLNVIALAGGSYLAWRGYTGTCPVKAALLGASTSAGRLSADVDAPSSAALTGQVRLPRRARATRKAMTFKSGLGRRFTPAAASPRPGNSPRRRAPPW